MSEEQRRIHKKKSLPVWGWVGIGIVLIGLILGGVVFGLSYLAVGRKLWPLIFAHALIDSIDFVGHYLGG